MKLDELVVELREYLAVLNVKQISDLDGDSVSRLAVKLASLNSTLGQYVAQAERDSNQAEMALEMAREKTYAEAREAGKTIADADSLKRTANEALKSAHIKLHYNWRLMSLLRMDTATLIDTLRSRGVVLRTDRDQS